MGVSRRWVLRAGAATAAALLLPEQAAEAATIVNPNTGVIPMTFPVRYGNYRAFRDNWHEVRAGPSSRWSHRLSLTQRAHDGIDVYPASYSYLGVVYAPFQAIVSAVCMYLGRPPIYRVSKLAPPPWNYSQVFQGSRSRYGHFIWLKSTASDASNGYFAFYCHLKNEETLRGLLNRMASGEVYVTPSTWVGRIGDSGNALGDPQLHLEIHYPIGKSYTCARCNPDRTLLTAINPYASLRAAKRRT
jgi:hypothetical protein